MDKGPDPHDRLLPPPPVEAKRPRKRRTGLDSAVRGTMGIIAAIGIVGAVAAGIIGVVIYQRYSAGLPTLDGLRTYQPPVVSRVYAGNGHLLAELATERRIFVPATAIPDLVKQAFIAAEDRSFYSHRGVDPAAVLRAAVTDLQHLGESRRPIGASTITQQVARNMLLGSNAVSFERKFKEILLAFRLERTLSKERILELYLNQIYLGQGAYGVVAAAETYFNKPLGDLSIAEAAMLASLPKSPSNYNPFRFPDAARARRDWVIDRMQEIGSISAEAAAAAHAQPVVPSAYRRPELVPGGDWFADEVKRQLIERFGEDAAASGGLAVRASLDPELQTVADRSLRQGLMQYDRLHSGWHGKVGHLSADRDLAAAWQEELSRQPVSSGLLPDWRLAIVLEAGGAAARVGWLEPIAGGVPAAQIATLSLADCRWARAMHPDGELGPVPHRLQDILSPGDLVMVEPGAPGSGLASLRQVPLVEGALVSLEPSTGRILAMSGGWSHSTGEFDRATQAQRQPGSSFKPFVYLTAMEQGVSPSEQFLDAPFVQGDWRPNNYELDFNGPTSLHVALEQSLNLVTVRLAQKIGMEAIAKTAIAFHEVDSMPRVLPAALGAVATTVLREAGAYAALDAGGREVVPSFIDSVQDRDGRVVWRPAGIGTTDGDTSVPPALTDTRPVIADPASTAQIVTMMQGVVLNGTGVPVVRGLDRPIAGKTGTSQEYNDAWFAGFTPDLVTVVWVGFDSPQTLGEKQTGAEVAGPVWHDFMKAALADRPVLQFGVPTGVTLYRWSAGSHDVIDAFKPGQEPGVSGNEVDASMVGDQTTAAGAAPIAAQPVPAGTGAGVDSGVGSLY